MRVFPRQALVVCAVAVTAMLSAGFGQAAENAAGQPQTSAPPRHGLDAHIHALHDTLNITEAQKDQWDALERVIRENREKMRQVIAERRNNAASGNALDDMNAYRKAAETHLENVKRLTAAFADVYNAMSAAQKKQADEIFRSRPRQDASLPTPPPTPDTSPK